MIFLSVCSINKNHFICLIESTRCNMMNISCVFFFNHRFRSDRFFFVLFRLFLFLTQSISQSVARMTREEKERVGKEEERDRNDFIAVSYQCARGKQSFYYFNNRDESFRRHVCACARACVSVSMEKKKQRKNNKQMNKEKKIEPNVFFSRYLHSH